MEECPECGGTGYLEWWDDIPYHSPVDVKCGLCHGTGHVTKTQAAEYHRNITTVYEAQRRYIRDQTAD